MDRSAAQLLGYATVQGWASDVNLSEMLGTLFKGSHNFPSFDQSGAV